MEAQLQQLAVNTGCSPRWVLGSHSKISARISLLTGFRPTTCLARESPLQYRRKPARCHSTTVRGVTTTRGVLHPDQSRLERLPAAFAKAAGVFVALHKVH